MPKNIEVCDAFMNNRRMHGNNLKSTGTRLFSYGTCIAEWDGSTLLINVTKYSVTTSRHLTLLKRTIGGYRPVVEVSNIPMGTFHLK